GIPRKMVITRSPGTPRKNAIGVIRCQRNGLKRTIQLIPHLPESPSAHRKRTRSFLKLVANACIIEGEEPPGVHGHIGILLSRCAANACSTCRLYHPCFRSVKQNHRAKSSGGSKWLQCCRLALA